MAREQQDSSGWGYHDISDHDDDMANYNSDESNSERNAFVGIPLIGPSHSPEKHWMLQGGVEEETKKKAGERKKSPVEERIDTVKFMETTAGVKRTREMTGTYEETTSRIAFHHR